LSVYFFYSFQNGASIDFTPFLYTQVNFTTFSLYQFDDRLRYQTTLDETDANTPYIQSERTGSNVSKVISIPTHSSTRQILNVFGATNSSDTPDSLLLSVVSDALARLSDSLPLLFEPVSKIVSCPPFCPFYKSVNSAHHINIIKTVIIKSINWIFLIQQLYPLLNQKLLLVNLNTHALCIRTRLLRKHTRTV